MSHFSTLKTELRDREALLEALADLGHDPQTGSVAIRGYQGQTVQAEVAVTRDEQADFGFVWNAAAGSYELVADLDQWRQPVPVERFLAQLTQRYALRTLLAATAEEGFQVSEQTTQLDGSIELVVTRWDG
ncbi:MAG: DUF1257 domain-containing protein [Cyanobacteriota bacterium]|nr:DUF1257 domain-containing protein [Cyanobacteriota bacterium]